MEVGLKDFHLAWFGKGGHGRAMGMDNWVCVGLGCCPATDEEGAEVQTDKKQITLRDRAPPASAVFEPPREH